MPLAGGNRGRQACAASPIHVAPRHGRHSTARLHRLPASRLIARHPRRTNCATRGQLCSLPCADRPRSRAVPQRQPTRRCAIHAAECKHRHPRPTGQIGPSPRAKRGGAGMARGGKTGREKDERRAVADRPQQLDPVMGGAGDQPPPCTHRPASYRPASSAPAVQTAMQPGSEPPVAGHHESDAAAAAERRDPLGASDFVRRRPLAQHDAAQLGRQASDHRQRIGQAHRVGEQP